MIDIHKPISPMEDAFKMRKEMQRIIKELEEFKLCITSLMENYIKSIDITIANAETFMRDNIVETTESIVNKAIEDGKITVDLKYNEQTEELDLVTEGEV